MPLEAAAAPAAYMAGTEALWRVPRLRQRPWAARVISAASAGSSAMTGRAPAASRRLATSLAVT